MGLNGHGIVCTYLKFGKLQLILLTFKLQFDQHEYGTHASEWSEVLKIDGRFKIINAANVQNQVVKPNESLGRLSVKCNYVLSGRFFVPGTVAGNLTG